METIVAFPGSDWQAFTPLLLARVLKEEAEQPKEDHFDYGTCHGCRWYGVKPSGASCGDARMPVFGCSKPQEERCPKKQ